MESVKAGSLSTIVLSSATIRECIFKYKNWNRPFYMVIDSLFGILLLHLFIEHEVFDYLPAFTNKTVKTLDFVIFVVKVVYC